MGRHLTMDLRSRLFVTVDDRMSCRAAAARLGAAPLSRIRWHATRRDTGDLAAEPHGADMRSHRVEALASKILAAWEVRRDITLVKLRFTLAGVALAVFVTGPHRLFARWGMTRKQDRAHDQAGPARRPEAAPVLVRRPVSDRSRWGPSE